jgi:hypothetical protein
MVETRSRSNKPSGEKYKQSIQSQIRKQTRVTRSSVVPSDSDSQALQAEVARQAQAEAKAAQAQAKAQAKAAQAQAKAAELQRQAAIEQAKVAAEQSRAAEEARHQAAIAQAAAARAVQGKGKGAVGKGKGSVNMPAVVARAEDLMRTTLDDSKRGKGVLPTKRKNKAKPVRQPFAKAVRAMIYDRAGKMYKVGNVKIGNGVPQVLNRLLTSITHRMVQALNTMSLYGKRRTINKNMVDAAFYAIGVTFPEGAMDKDVKVIRYGTLHTMIKRGVASRMNVSKEAVERAMDYLNSVMYISVYNALHNKGEPHVNSKTGEVTNSVLLVRHLVNSNDGTLSSPVLNTTVTTVAKRDLDMTSATKVSRFIRSATRDVAY